MIIYVNQNNEIKDVNITSDDTLTQLEIIDETNPFKGWSVAKICCYKATVSDGQVTMMTPYVDTRLIEHIDQLGNQNEVNSVDITDSQEAIGETAEICSTNITDIDDLQQAVAELTELVIELRSKLNSVN